MKSKVAPSANWKKILPTIPPSTNTGKKRKARKDNDTISAKPASKKARGEDVKAEEKEEKVIPNKEDLWFGDDIEAKDLALVHDQSFTLAERKQRAKDQKKAIVEKMNAVTGKAAEPGKYVAIDCEMVGVGPEGVESALGRVSLVNFNGVVLLDTFVKPQERVTDYRTHVSGIEKKHFENAITFKEAQEKVASIIGGRILVGHAIHNDLRVLMLDHPHYLLRDTSTFQPFRQLVGGRTPGLKMLVKEVLNIDIQSGRHSSVEDARFTIQLYKKVKDEWEKSFGARYGLRMKKFVAKTQKKSVQAPDTNNAQ